MIPFDSFKICDIQIPNCIEGNSSSSQTCSKCEDLHKLSSDSKSCNRYSIEDCKTYNTSPNPPICTDCNQGYMLDSANNK